jgi:iron complex outermembrane receptor protein
VLRDTEEYAANAEINVGFGGIRLKSLTAYADFTSFRQNDEDFSEANASLLELTTDSESFSQEFQLLPEQAGRLQWVLGAFYFHERAVEDFFFRTPTNPNSFTFRQDVKTDSTAVYAQVEYGITDAITLLAGGRYTKDDKRFIYQSPVGAPDLAPDEAEFDKFTWRLGVNVDLTPDNLLYFSTSTGFRSGGFNNGGNPPVPFYGPQTVTAYEVGLKNLFREARLTFNVSGFYNDYEDILANTFVQVGPTNVVARANAGSSRAYGAEAELTWRPVGGLSIDANAAWLNARFKTFSATRPLALATGYTLVPGTTNQLDLSGNRVPLSPEFTFNLGGAMNSSSAPPARSRPRPVSSGRMITSSTSSTTTPASTAVRSGACPAIQGPI